MSHEVTSASEAKIHRGSARGALRSWRPVGIAARLRSEAHVDTKARSATFRTEVAPRYTNAPQTSRTGSWLVLRRETNVSAVITTRTAAVYISRDHRWISN